MDLAVTVYEYLTEYLFIVNDETGENTFEYRWSKTQPEDQTLEEYLQNCKREACLLAEHEIAKKQPPLEIIV